MILETLRSTRTNVVGLLTPDREIGSFFCGITVLGDDSEITNFSPAEIVLANGIGALPQKTLRWKVASMMQEKGYRFINVIHPSSYVSPDSIISEGVQIMAGSIVQPGSNIGQHSIINTGVSIDHDCIVGKNCHVAPGVVCSGGITVGDNVHIGTGARLIQGITIGNGSIIAAGTTVFQDVPERTIIKQAQQVELAEIEG